MSREALDLCGLWRFRPDPFARGTAAGWHAADHDASLWRPVEVPCPFDRCGPGLEGHEGSGWFRREFRAPAQWAGRRVVLRFEGVNYHAQVWLNAQRVGGHEDGFLPFELPVGHCLRYGEANVVAVLADNVRRPEDVPGRQRGWRPYGGILREVRLIATDPARIDDVWIDAAPDGGLRAEVSVRNDRSLPLDAVLALSVLDATGARVASLSVRAGRMEPGGAGAVRLEGRVPGAAPWSPSSPALYLARVALCEGTQEADAVEARFGFRRIEVAGARLLLNGEPLFLAGFNRHEDSPLTGPCPDMDTVRRDIEEIKALGANFVRLAHYPHHPGELALCDELGLLVMCEIPLYWWPGSADGEEACTRKLAAACRQLEAMIRRDRSHPAVIIWSVSNETNERRPEVREGNAELVRLAQQLDPTRPAVHVSDKWPDSPSFEPDDLICVNGYPSLGAMAAGRDPLGTGESAAFWRDGLAGLHARYPGKPILVTEFGCPSFEGLLDGGPHSEQMQAAVIETEYEGMQADYVCGWVIWCWADHPWPEFDGVGLHTSPYGVVTRERRKLAACEAARRIFARAARRP